MNNTVYHQKISSRNVLRFALGLIPRTKKFLTNTFVIWVARRNGASIGNFVTMPYALAKKANSNFVVGDHVSIQTDLIDLRSRVEIKSYAIIGFGVEIITASHNIDSVEWEHKYYGITVEEYVWLATKVLVLPSCRKIGRGAVCAAGSVVVKNIEENCVVAGNPATKLRDRKVVHENLCVESLLGNDLIQYLKVYSNRW